MVKIAWKFQSKKMAVKNDELANFAEKMIFFFYLSGIFERKSNGKRWERWNYLPKATKYGHIFS